jgi:hypothetical protein
MTWAIRCDVCGGRIAAHFELFDHVHPPVAPAEQQAFQAMQEEFLGIQRTLQQAPRRPGR